MSYLGSGNVIPLRVRTERTSDTSSQEGEGQTHSMGSIEREMRSRIAKLTDCSYPDTFDWAVYDKIAATYPNRPRGGVLFKSSLKLANVHPSCVKCHYALEIDAYGRGCIHDCAYCYAKETLTAYGYWNEPVPFPLDLSQIRKLFYLVFETDRETKWREVLQRRVPMRIGSMSDSFMWIDTRYGITKELLRILNHYDYPYVIFTRSDLVAHDDYAPLLNPRLAAVQFSISGNNNGLMRRLEPGAPSYIRRLKAISALRSMGIWTSVRINPLFPTHPDGYFSDREATIQRFGGERNVPHIPFYDDNFINELADAGAPSILAGFVRLSRNAVSAISKSLDIDFRLFYRQEVNRVSADKHFSTSEIDAYYKRIAQQCKASNVRFSTCYIGNGDDHYFRHQELWSNTDDCCDIKGNVEAFHSSSQEIPWDQRLRLNNRPPTTTPTQRN